MARATEETPGDPMGARARLVFRSEERDEGSGRRGTINGAFFGPIGSHAL
jgi:hypothetical protein